MRIMYSDLSYLFVSLYTGALSDRLGTQRRSLGWPCDDVESDTTDTLQLPSNHAKGEICNACLIEEASCIACFFLFLYKEENTRV